MITPFDFKLIFILIIISYLLGSISSAILLCRLFKLPDPRSQGSKNPGTTNVLRIAGKPLAATVLLLDVLKGFSVVWCAKLLSMPNLVIASAAVAVFIGQLFPIFFNFRGGKGVAITLGIMLALCWKLALLCLMTWLAVFMIFKISSLAGLSATAVAIILSMLSLCIRLNIDIPKEFAIIIIIFGMLILFKHKSNIQNLFNKTEGKI